MSPSEMYACLGHRGRIMPCNYTRDEACLITGPRASYKNCPSARQCLSNRSLFRLIMRFCVNAEITKPLTASSRSRHFLDPPRWLVQLITRSSGHTKTARNTHIHTHTLSIAENTTARSHCRTSNGNSHTQTDN